MKKFLQINLSEDLHKSFKKYCFDNDITMTEIVTRFIKKILDKNVNKE